jgi:peptidoglycan lytic transglycosylase G
MSRKPKRAGGKGRGKARRGALLGWLLFLLLLAVPAGLAGYWLWNLKQPYQGFSGPEVIVTVDPGMKAVEILKRLESQGVLANAGLARVYLIYVLRNPPIQAGDYLFHGPETTDQVLRKLIKGEVVSHRVTLVEGLTLEETAEALAQGGFGRREIFLDLLRSPELIADLDPAANDLEGYLFPNTYTFHMHTPEGEVVKALVKAFRNRFERDIRPILAAHPRPRSLRDVVTLASIVEKEAKVDAERPLIAAVYQNRLDRNIGLAADPTVIYAMKKAGIWNGNIRRDDLHIDSPYNTYRYAGLPPGPICSPGLASLKAAAEPASVPYLYFVSRNDGTHVFSQTLAEHSRNVDIWQRQYFREKRERERREGAAHGR